MNKLCISNSSGEQYDLGSITFERSFRGTLTISDETINTPVGGEYTVHPFDALIFIEPNQGTTKTLKFDPRISKYMSQ